MRILIYAHAFAPKIGGAETYVMLLAEGLAARPEVRQVAVITPTPAAGFCDAPLPFRVVRRPSVRSLWRLVGEADVVLLAGPCLAPLAMAYARHRPVAVEHHLYQAVCPNGLLFQQPHESVCPGHFMQGRYVRCLRCVHATGGWKQAAVKVLATFPRRWMCAKAAANIAITRHVAQRIALPSSEVVYHGVPDPGHAGNGPVTDLTTFAYVGRLVTEKGIPLLLEAAKILKKEGLRFHVTIIGDGPERDRLEVVARNLGLSDEIFFAGFLRGEALHRVVRNVTALVMPSIMEETAGLAAIEQMMRGRLVVAADIGGLGEMVDDAGLKFRPGDPRGLAACLRRVVEEPSLAQALGERARRRAVRAFSIARMVDEHLAIFTRLIARRARPNDPVVRSAAF